VQRAGTGKQSAGFVNFRVVNLDGRIFRALPETVWLFGQSSVLQMVMKPKRCCGYPQHVYLGHKLISIPGRKSGRTYDERVREFRVKEFGFLLELNLKGVF